MALQKVYVSPSKLADLETCGFMYAKKHIERWKEETVSHALVFGSAFDDTIDCYLRNKLIGVEIDIVGTFEMLWDERTSKEAVAYSSTTSSTEMRQMGGMMASRFPEAWDATGYSIALDPEGEPIMQRNLEIELPHNIVLRTKLDLVVKTREDKILLMDLKTAAAIYPEFLTPLSEQLTAYQIAVEAHGPSLGIEKLDGLGFIEAIKRKVPKRDGQGPTVEAPVVAPRRTDVQVAEYLQKVQWAVEDIRRGRFPRRPRAGYNTPCALCFMQNYCAFGETEGIVMPELKNHTFAFAA